MSAPPTYISSLVLEDWRQYKGVQEIPLEPIDDKHFNAFIGENGTGKTTLVKAVQACLNGSVSGEPSAGESSVEHVEPHVNADVFRELDTGEAANGSIQLYLRHKGTNYVITREFSSRKTADGCVNSIDDDFVVERHEQSGWVEVDQPSALLAQILPPEVQQYYFFDGERLDAFFEDGYQDKVREAVRELSHVDVLENGREHLDNLRNEQRRKARSKSPAVREAREKRNTKRTERMDIIHEKASIEREIADKEASLAAVEEKMGAARDDDVLELVEDRTELETVIDNLLDTEEELNNELDRHVVETGAICLASDALETATEAFDRMGARDQLPPVVRRKFLDGLLEEDKCLCGCDLQKHPKHRQRVEELRDATPGISDRLIEASYEFPDTLTTGAEGFKDLRDTKRTLREKTRKRLAKETKKEDITEELRGHDVPEEIDLAALDKQREQLRTELRTLRNRLGRLDERLDSTETELERLNERIERELQKEERSEALMQDVERFKRGAETLRSIKQDLMADVRQEIENFLNTSFNELTWKNVEYDLFLEPDFSLRMEGPDGQRQVERLSAGETQLLALSFIAALTEVSEFDAPVLVDTPVGRIDQRHRAAIGQKLPAHFAEQQVTLLFTDTEFDETISGTLSGHLANTYELANDDRVTLVEEYNDD